MHLTSFQFGDYELDTQAEELRFRGQPVFLPMQALAVLVLLVQNRGRIVTRNEIFDRVWKGVLVNDGSLTQAVWHIRNALSGDCRGFIKTVRGRGYRFVAPLHVEAAE